MSVHSDLAVKALKERVAAKMGLGVNEAAEGVIRLVNNSMAKAISIVSVERGRDPRDYSMVVFGGAGPLHACDLAEELGVGSVIVPSHPGLFSAYGLLTTDVIRAFSLPVFSDNLNAEVHFAKLRSMAEESLRKEGHTSYTFRYYVDLRYQGQSYEVSLKYNSGDDLRKLFDQKHKEFYGYSSDDPIEIVNVKINALVPTSKITPQRHVSKRVEAVPSARRDAWMAGTFISVPVFNREDISSGTQGKGPCIIEEYDATTVVNPSWSWAQNEFGDLQLSR